MHQSIRLAADFVKYGKFILLGLILLAVAGSLQASTLTVGCPSGGTYTSVQAAVNAAAPGDVIVVTGICTESVFIGDMAFLTIQANSPGSGTIVALTDNDAIDIQRSHGIVLVNLIFSGGTGSVAGAGVAAFDNAQVVINNCTIQNHVDVGVFLDLSTRVNINGSTIQGNGDGVDVSRESIAIIRRSTIVKNVAVGVFALDRSAVQFAQANEVAGNGDTGIFLQDLSRVVLGGGPNSTTVENNVSAGVVIAAQSLFRAQPNSKIKNNGAGCTPGNFCGGVVALRNSTLRFNLVEVSGNTGDGIEVDQGVDVGINGSTVSNNTENGLRIRHLSIGDFVTANTFAGNGGASVSCDETSVLTGDLTGMTKVKCGRIEQAHPRSEKMKEMKEMD